MKTKENKKCYFFNGCAYAGDGCSGKEEKSCPFAGSNNFKTAIEKNSDFEITGASDPRRFGIEPFKKRITNLEVTN